MSNQNYTYKVEWKYSSVVGSHRADFVVENLEELLRILNKSEGVNRNTCDHIYVHQIYPDGRVAEVYAHDKKNENVVNIVEASLKRIKDEVEHKPKPRVKLKHTKDTVRTFVSANYGRYKAYEAT